MMTSKASDNPLISVVIATYNRPAYLRNAIASVLTGNYSNVEIIVADDLGSEANRKTATDFGDKRIVYHPNETTLGAGRNHFQAFRNLASGEYISILNDDDEWEPSFLSRLVPVLMENPSVVIAFSDHYLMDENGRIDLKATDENTHRWRRDVLSPGLHQPFWRCLADESLPISQASVIRRNAIDWWDFPVEVDVFWDLWLGYLACRTEKACYYLPERLTKYRYHSGSLTSSGSGSLGLAYVYSRLMQTPELAAMRNSLRRKCGDAHLYYGLFLLQERRAREARRHVWKAMTLRGPTPKTGVALALASMPGVLGSGLLRTLRGAWHRRSRFKLALKR